MKDIPNLKPRGEFSALIVDGSELTQRVVRSALENAGIGSSRCTDSAFYALKYCEQTRFDMVFISFDVKCDKDGFNLLEEMKFKRYINSGTTVVFLSAETSIDLVNCVVELQPADFWAKPLNQSRVEQRLSYLLEINAILHKSKYLFDTEQYATAIYSLERQLQDPKLKNYYPHINRLIGQSLMNLFQFEEAENFYRKLAQTYNYGWVQVELARAMFKQDKFDQAVFLTKSLLERKDTRFATYDLLAERAIDKEQYGEAYDFIKAATALAPRNIERNRKAWNLARLNHDKVGQLEATKNMAKYAKNSIHDSPQLTLNVIRSTLDLASSVGDEEASMLLGSAKKLLVKISSNVHSRLEFSEQLNVLDARISSANDDKQQAQRMIKDTKTDVSDQSIEDSLDLVKAFHELGYWEKSLQVMDQVKSKIEDRSLIGHVVSEYVNQEYDERRDIHFTHRELCNMATAYYSSQRYISAFSYLNQAMRLSPKNTSVALSILKVLVKLAESDDIEAEHIIALQASITTLEENLQQQERYEKSTRYLETLQASPNIVLKEYWQGMEQ